MSVCRKCGAQSVPVQRDVMSQNPDRVEIGHQIEFLLTEGWSFAWYQGRFVGTFRVGNDIYTVSADNLPRCIQDASTKRVEDRLSLPCLAYGGRALSSSLVKVYQVNSCDWWAGYDLESVIAAFKESMGFDDDEVENPHELCAGCMERLKFVDGDDPINADGTPGGKLTFREALQRMVDRGDALPCFFANTEY